HRLHRPRHPPDPHPFPTRRSSDLAARCRGLLLAARGDTSGAEQALQEALRHHQQLAMPFELGRTLLVIGQVQRRAKRKKIAKQRSEEHTAELPSPTKLLFPPPPSK